MPAKQQAGSHVGSGEQLPFTPVYAGTSFENKVKLKLANIETVLLIANIIQ